MYKIVETIEKGSKQLTVVPQAWEQEGILFWPKMKAEKLIKIGTSIPEDSWFQMSCKLKRRELETYETAEKELRAMLKKEDSTESEEPEVVPRPKRVRVMLPKKSTSGYDFNEMAIKAVCTDADATTSKTIEYGISSENTLVTDSSEQNVVYSYINADQISDNNYSVEQSSCLTATINDVLPTSALSTILGNQRTSENQLKILQQLSKLEAMGDVVAGKVSNINCTCKKATPIVQNDSIKQIETIEDLDALEESLRDKEIMKEKTEKLSYVCGKRGDGHGVNNSFTLVDRMFTRKFMTLCSWAGGARGEREKVAFKMYKNVILLFYNVIQLSDKSFTHKDCEEFFKNVIRNSTRRSKSDFSRASTVKRRSKKIASQNDTSKDISGDVPHKEDHDHEVEERSD
ncbi:uncharacterized protein LOC115888657 isoform X2 [Sitophilus oryzae]|uniref:Uncharacterized protein LOC115874081 isoform X2 n=1 Tax=Sitophilus oryzae TaxID=7048 RepID=A0A6J2YN90_SITOR|nr:uncharacterized protein LOC115874081 isoform X2 [Sitophilus oryzae]XP_030764295.1 uncharacterized protein LOC115888657 isoform X2 [Sitophilus oryzae]